MKHLKFSDCLWLSRTVTCKDCSIPSPPPPDIELSPPRPILVNGLEFAVVKYFVDRNTYDIRF